jgi:parallel beta-helix repeat protein
VLRNQISGNGYVRSADPNFGIGILSGGDNLIEGNFVTGNVTGIRILPAAIGNIIRGNVVLGNPPILVANNAPDNAPVGLDILNLSSTGANTFENNLCSTSMNAPCANLKPVPDLIPIVTAVVLDQARVRAGGSLTATFSGSNLTNATYFDIRFRAPGATSDDVTFNWQQGVAASHSVAPNTAIGDWTINGARAHQDPNDHSGPFEPVRVNLSVFISPF